MAGPIIDRSHIQSTLKPGIDAFFGAEYGKMDEEFRRIYKFKKADLATEIVQLMPGFSQARDFPEGTVLHMDSFEEGFAAKFVIKTVGLAASVSLQAMRDNKYKDKIPTVAKGLSDALKRKRNADAAHVLNQADNPDFPGGDRKALCHTAHPTQDAPFSNVVRGDLNVLTLKAMIINSRKMRDHRGEVAIVDPVRVIGPVDLEEEAYVAMKSAMKPGRADNDANWIKTQLSEYVPMRYLDDPQAFWLQTDAPEGLICYDEMKPETDADFDFHSKAALFSVIARWQFGNGDPRGVIGNMGDSS